MSVRHVLALCDRWDRLSKGESPTTAAIREALAEPEPRLTCGAPACTFTGWPQPDGLIRCSFHRVSHIGFTEDA